jgi:hypothetical protein
LRTLLALAIVVPICVACATTPPDASQVTPRPSLPVLVTSVALFWDAGKNPCLGPTTMTFTVEVLNGKAGDQVVATLTGPGLPGQISDPVTTTDTLIKHRYPLPGGSGSWEAQIVSVGGNVPNEVPGASLSAKAHAFC